MFRDAKYCRRIGILKVKPYKYDIIFILNLVIKLAISLKTLNILLTHITIYIYIIKMPIYHIVV